MTPTERHRVIAGQPLTIREGECGFCKRSEGLHCASCNHHIGKYRSHYLDRAGSVFCPPCSRYGLGLEWTLDRRTAAYLIAHRNLRPPLDLN